MTYARFLLALSGLCANLTVMNVAHTQVRHPAAVAAVSVGASAAAYTLALIEARVSALFAKVASIVHGGAR